MNEEDTLALWRLGKGEWEGWARSLIEKKDALKGAGAWSTDWYGEGQNDETKAWLQEAAADFTKAVFETSADFAGFAFPGPATFERARFSGAANFAGAAFLDNANFDRAQFASSDFTGVKFSGFASFAKTQFDADAHFENTEFLRICDLAPCVRFRSAQFGGAADFSGAQFAGAAEFPKTAFATARFDGCEFRDDTLFGAAQFTGTAGFAKTRFTGARVDFERCAFGDKADFSEAHFGGSWAGLVISGACCVSFENASFEKDVTFRKTWFVGESQFKGARFKAPAAFDETLFVMPANFAPGVFSAGASFTSARFEHEANFTEAQFLGACEFTAAKFAAEARFANAHFAAPALFVRTEFLGAADFHGVSAEAELAFDGARCTAAPDFSEGKFAQALALDKLAIIKQKRGVIQWLKKLRGEERQRFAPATVRALAAAPVEATAVPNDPDIIVPAAPVLTRKTSAATAQASAKNEARPVEAESPKEETAEEKMEEKAEKKSEAPPPPPPMAPPPAPAPEVVMRQAADGRPPRSLLRLLLAWIFMILVFTPFYLGQRPAEPAETNATLQSGDASLTARVRDAAVALAHRSCVQGNSHAGAEALFLSAKNALVFVPWENDLVMRRAYGCLYGVEGSAPLIPVAVSLGALLQAMLSLAFLAAVFFSLAERLKRK